MFKKLFNVEKNMATLFKEVNYNLATLINSINMDLIGLLDFQRPFIWLDIKVRELIDCVFKGYPVNNCLFWECGIPSLKQQYKQSKLYKMNLEKFLKI